MYGEHWSRTGSGGVHLGSSPHVRGAPHALAGPHVHRGIIPACTGSTHGSAVAPNLPWDHPRMYGEHSSFMREMFSALGSSPHVRGALKQRRGGWAFLGIIPACTGSTNCFSDTCNNIRDHPRMYGEHWSCCTSRLEARGSSPHVRGAQQFHSRNVFFSGIIPACTGSTIVQSNVTGW